MANNVTFTKTMAAASANNIAVSQSPGAAALTLNGSAVAGGVATIDAATVTNTAVGRRVILQSGGNDSAISFLITGTNASGNVIVDTVAGTNAGTAQSNLDFVTVTNIIGSAAIAGTIVVGTNGVGSSEWKTWNWQLSPPMNVGFAVELVGTANFTVQYTYDDPNNLPPGVAFPLPFTSVISAATATIDGTISTPFIATRLLINSGTGTLRVRTVQAGIG